MGNSASITERGIVGGPTAAPYNDPNYIYTLLGNAINERAAKTATINPADVAAALGATQSGSSALGVDPSTLWGLSPDQVDTVAKTRASNLYQQALSTQMALKQAQEIAGVPEQRDYENKRAIQAQADLASLAKEQMIAGYHLAATEASVKGATPLSTDKVKAAKTQKIDALIAAGKANQVSAADLATSMYGDILRTDESGGQAITDQYNSVLGLTGDPNIAGAAAASVAAKVKSAKETAPKIKAMFPHLYGDNAPASTGSKTLTPEIAKMYLDANGNDPAKARAAAQKDGYK